MKIHTSLILFVLNAGFIQAQQALKIGDKIPDWELSSLMNENTAAVHLSEYKGKSILLSFWSTGCSANYQILPEFADFQQKYKNKLKVLLISDDDSEKVKGFFNKRKSLAALGLPMFSKDTLFAKMFPHTADPLIVLIASDGRIKAITEPSYLTEKNLEMLIANVDINLPVATPVEVIDFRKPLFTTQFVNNDNLIFHSVLTTSVDKISSGVSFNNLDRNRMKLLITNSTLFGMYALAYSPRIILNASDFSTRIIANFKNKQLLTENENNGVQEKQKSYCYELVVQQKAGTNNTRLLNYMQTDLDRYFNMVSRIERRKTKCYVLSEISKNHTLNDEERYTQEWVDKLEFNNQSIASIAAMLQRYKMLDLPLIYEIPLVDKFSFIISKKYISIEALQTDLKKAGLNINVAEKELDFLIINEQ